MINIKKNLKNANFIVLVPKFKIIQAFKADSNHLDKKINTFPK